MNRARSSPRNSRPGFLSKVRRRLNALYCRLMLRVCDPLYIMAHLNDWSRWVGAAEVLRRLGAEIGENTNLSWDILIQNSADGRCDKLRIGHHVYIGPQCVFDLASEIIIEEDAAIGAGVFLITHADVGNRPLSKVFPRQEGRIVIRRGTWLGVRATVLHGVSVGPGALVGAGSLVNRDVPPGVVAFGSPCRVIRQVEGLNAIEMAESSRESV